jgi:hypothetical protein
MRAHVFGSRILMITAANRFGLYSCAVRRTHHRATRVSCGDTAGAGQHQDRLRTALRACNVIRLRSSGQPSVTVQTTFCSVGCTPPVLPAVTAALVLASIAPPDAVPSAPGTAAPAAS